MDEVLRDLSEIERWVNQARGLHAIGDAKGTTAALYMISVLSSRQTGPQLTTEAIGGEGINSGAAG